MWSRLPARRSMRHWRGQLSQIRPCSFQSCSMQHGINARTQRDFSPTGSDYRGAFISDHSYQFTCVCLLHILRIADVPLVSKHWIWRHISSFFLFKKKHKNVWVLNTCEPALSGNPRLVIHCCEFGDTGAARGALLCGNWDANVYHWLGLVPSRCTRERAQERGVRNTEPQRECGLCLFLTQTQLMQDLCILPCPSTFSSAV